MSTKPKAPIDTPIKKENLTSPPKKSVTKIEEVDLPTATLLLEATKPPKREHKQLEYENAAGPANWEKVYHLIQEQRKRTIAPVDQMGCCALIKGDEPEKVRRFQTLVSLMLSSQTRDEMTAAAVKNLRAFGCTPEIIVATPEEKLKELIRPVGFYNRKAGYLKEAAQYLLDNYDGDIPQTVEELCKIKGVGPKMAYLTANVAWKRNFGIGVDVHVHRISNRLGWVDTKTPEQTRTRLEEWLPESKWMEINPMLVGFGQTICKNSPRCAECDVAKLCPSANIQPKKSRSRKKSGEAAKKEAEEPKPEPETEEEILSDEFSESDDETRPVPGSRKARPRRASAEKASVKEEVLSDSDSSSGSPAGTPEEASDEEFTPGKP